MDDVEDVYLYAKDDQVTKYLTWETHQNITQSKRVIEDVYLSRPGIYAIELKSEGKCIGCIDIRVIPEHHKAGFGYVLNRSYWNQGYMTEALNLILELAFTKLNLNRVEAQHYVGNEASGRVMLKCGMTYEGTGRKEELRKDRFVDVVHYGILREDWDRLSKNTYLKRS